MTARRILLLFAMLAASWLVQATETENYGIRILPAGDMTIDGKADDWNLAAGRFVCGDVENLREKLAVWVHAAYDDDNLYVLARFRDETPLSNPGLAGSDQPWNGDSLQLRIIADTEWRAENGKKAIAWVNGWRDREGKDAIDIDIPWKTNAADRLTDAIPHGAKQACTVDADGKGYTQEMLIPWKLLIRGGITPAPGEQIIFSAEPNFNTSSGYRVTLKGIFATGVVLDRVFTFMNDKSWGTGTFMPAGDVEPQPLRLADNREFPVNMVDGKPVVDWSQLFEEKEILGFEELTFTMPQDGYVSLIIKNADGQVVRQLLNANFRSKGTHTVKWDGLTNTSHLTPGEVVEAGDYTWEAITHTGIGMRLIGWADNAGRSPWRDNKGDWGGDHGYPCDVATHGKTMLLGWSGSEAGKALVCTNLDGQVQWRHKRGGFGGATEVVTDGKIVYVNDNQLNQHIIYRVDIKKGQFKNWEGKDTADLLIENGAQGMAIANGKLYVGQPDAVMVLDAKTGEKLSSIAVADVKDVQAAADGSIHALSGTSIMKIEGDSAKAVVENLDNPAVFTIGADGAYYVGLGDPHNHVQVFDAAGAPTRSIGKAGGRPLFGKWEQDGMRFIDALAIDSTGTLWVAEKDKAPKRFSCWNAETGEFIREFFGPTGYGAQGGAISPEDPLTMVGSGCEWRIDPETGRAHVVGVFSRFGMSSSRFARSEDGRMFVAISGSFIQRKPVHIYERLGPGDYKLRTKLSRIIKERMGRRNKMEKYEAGLRVWSDANDDQEEQEDEVHEYEIDLGGWIAGWYLPFAPDMTFYGTYYQLAVTGWTDCGAPLYDASQAKKLPRPEADNHGGGMGTTRGLGTVDGTHMLYNSQYGKPHSTFPCYDIETGKLAWSYPSNYVGVHGGHKAPPKATGMIRAAYDIVGTGKLPEPIGNIFVIGTDKGEWHILTADGYYLTSLFEANVLKIRFPEMVVPGAILDSVPPGAGAEDFGGSMTVGDDGNLYLQAGKTAYINIRVVGLDSVAKLGNGSISVSDDELKLAANFREELMQASIGTQMTSVQKTTIQFTGDLRKDFKVDKPISFEKNPDTRASIALAYDDDHLYLGWTVKDPTPWENGASEPFEMYAMGDTVDFQIGTDPDADEKRTNPVQGDLRLSIGNLQGKPTAVIYRPVATEKAPRKFFSGVIREGYEMDSVTVLTEAEIHVDVDEARKTYTVEVKVPLAAIGLAPKTGMTLSADIGVTHGNAEGNDTVLRSYWNNQSTGLVADEVFELKLTPENWGKLTFQ